MSKFADFGNDLYTGNRSINFIGRRKVFYVVAIVMVAAAAILPFVKPFNLGIEFKGGSEFRISASQSIAQEPASAAVHKIVPGVVVEAANVGTNSLRVQTAQLSPTQSESVRQALAAAYKVPANSVSSSFVGAEWGQDITSKAVNGLIWFLVLATVLMALYFRTFKMSAAAIISLIHDLLITAGVYGALGFEVTPAAVIGFLTILGYSLYDTVVVFDKIRENTFEVEFSESRTFGEQVNLAINQTLVRSINTSVVAVLPVAAILFIGAIVFGAGTLRDISLALFIGIIVGTYSTIFIAAPLYSHLREGEAKYKKAAAKVLAARG